MIDIAREFSAAKEPHPSHFADGLALIQWPNKTATGVVERCRFEDHETAGIAAYGAHVEVTSCTFDCNGLALVGEVHGGKEGEFEIHAGSVCGCEAEGEEELCAMQTSGSPEVPELQQ